MTDDEGAAYVKVLAEYRALEEAYVGQDGFPDEIDVRIDELEVGMEKLEVLPLIFDSEEIKGRGLRDALPLWRACCLSGLRAV